MTTFNITDVYTSKYAGGKETRYTPMVGESYRLTAEFDVAGTPKAPYPVHFHMADRWATVEMSDVTPGHKRVSQSFFLPLDGPIPWDVDVDPYHYADGVDPTKSPIPHTFRDVLSDGGGVQNQTVRIGRLPFTWSKAKRTGTFEPAPPPISIEYYNAVAAAELQSLEVTFPSGAAVERMVVMFGKPSSDTWQTVTSAECSVQSGAGTKTLVPLSVDNPSHYPVYFWDHRHLPAKPVSVLATYVVTLRNVRVDRAKLRGVTWKQLDDARKQQPYAYYTLPDAVCESLDPKVATFVHDTLGADYRRTTTPYDAARKLFHAVLAPSPTTIRSRNRRPTCARRRREECSTRASATAAGSASCSSPCSGTSASPRGPRAAAGSVSIKGIAGASSTSRDTAGSPATARSGTASRSRASSPTTSGTFPTSTSAPRRCAGTSSTSATSRHSDSKGRTSRSGARCTRSRSRATRCSSSSSTSGPTAHCRGAKGVESRPARSSSPRGVVPARNTEVQARGAHAAVRRPPAGAAERSDAVTPR